MAFERCSIVFVIIVMAINPGTFGLRLVVPREILFDLRSTNNDSSFTGYIEKLELLNYKIQFRKTTSFLTSL